MQDHPKESECKSSIKKLIFQKLFLIQQGRTFLYIFTPVTPRVRKFIKNEVRGHKYLAWI